MQPNVKLDRTLVAVEVGETVHVMLELVAPPAPVTERAPIDVVAVIDRSGSMSGQPLASVIDATNLLVRLLGPNDRIAVVTFDDQVDMVMPLAHHEPARAADVLSRVHAGGSTNLSGGWLKGLEILSAHGRPEAMKRVIVLTDGWHTRPLRLSVNSTLELTPLVALVFQVKDAEWALRWFLIDATGLLTQQARSLAWQPIPAP